MHNTENDIQESHNISAPLLKRCQYVPLNIIHLRIGPEELTEGWCPAVLSICGLIVRRTICIILEINTYCEILMVVAVLVNRLIQEIHLESLRVTGYQIIFKVRYFKSAYTIHSHLYFVSR